MKVLVVGGGIGGAAFATFLARTGKFEVVLAEQAPEFRTIGYAIGLWENGVRILKELGASHAIEKQGYNLPWLAIEDYEGHPLTSFFFRAFSENGPVFLIERSTLHFAVVDAMKKEKVELRLNSRVVSCEEKENGVLVTFADGRSETFSLVVAADGIRSHIREQVFGRGYSHPYGWSVWSVWAPEGYSHAKGGVEVVGEGNIFMTYPLEGKTCLIFVSYLETPQDSTPEERLALLKRQFAGAKPSVRAAVDLIVDPKVFYDHLAHIDMPLWYKGRVVLIGDAQHAMSPVTGMGASMALEDAYVLAEELAKTEGKEEFIPAALARFAARREKRIRQFKRVARKVEYWVFSKGFVSKIRDFFIRLMPLSYFMVPLRRFVSAKP